MTAVSTGLAPAALRQHARKVNPLGLLTGVVLLAVWQLLVAVKALNLKYLPTPWQIITSYGELFTGTPFPGALGHTVSVTLIGWAVASAAAIVVALLLGLSRIAWNWSMSSMELLRALPAITMLPIAVVIFGLSSTMELVLVMYVSFWPVLIGTARGIRSVDPLLRDVGDTLRLGRLAVIRKIVLPAAAPLCVVGLRISLTLALVLAVVAEIVANPAGIGYQIAFEQQALRPDLMFACIFVVGLLGIVLNALLVLAVRLTMPGVSRTLEDAA
ncbi:MAG TPA: ABC transporter permease [Trebonia sp.]|jgi:ABC-type nitrate/sulfonate/bicarbonate transport system permease component|nr:ABC transporter permease [Trebonia sp.]